MITKTFRVVILTGIVALILSACAPAAQEPITVNISLTEFSFQSSLTTFEAGQTYRFVIVNDGTVNHEFTIMPPGPTVMEMEGMDHNMEGALAHVGEEELTPGATATVEYTFREAATLGSIEFACHLTAHYEAGMFTPISVDA
ncbi:MAG: hypothetical protein WEC37_03795 [Anaerolineales bacterium]